MILIDALYINNGGGKILLDYLISKIEENNIKTFYLLDERIKFNHPKIVDNKVVYLKGNFFKRQQFYLKSKSSFNKVLCFGNLPPNIRLNAEVFTYFQNPMYLYTPKEFSLKERIKFNLKVLILKLISGNTNYWIVQSNLIKEKLHQKFLFHLESIKVLPFYPQLKKLNIEIKREKNTFLYVSNATPHKNHQRLIEAFCVFFDQYKKGKLILTVNKDYPEIVDFIDKKISLGYPIENIGFVDRDTLQKRYLSSEFLIFPSLTESFGLGLIEAIECGCKIIGSDLPYTYEVCEPTIVFDPLKKSSIFSALEKSIMDQNLKPSIPKIKNNINELINLLQNNS